MGNHSGRGLNQDFIQVIKNNEKIKGYLKELESKKLFVGIRNQYFNLYYRAASVAKFEMKHGGIVCTTSAAYYGMNNEKDIEVPIDKFDLDKVMRGIDEHLKIKNTQEKECQQNLIMANNNEKSNSEWFCIDMEYAMGRESCETTNYGRFDLIAVSKNRDKESGKYKVALIELKVGSNSFGKISKYFSKLSKEKGYRKGIINVTDKNDIGSGILGHFSDYVRYLEEPYRYQMLREEISEMLKNYQELELLPNDYHVTSTDFDEKPIVVFLTYSGDEKVKDVEDSFMRYLLNKKVAGHPCSKINVYDMWVETGRQYIPRFQYVFREGIADSNIRKPIFKDINISEAIDVNSL